jgi:hypothetical protein
MDVQDLNPLAIDPVEDAERIAEHGNDAYARPFVNAPCTLRMQGYSSDDGGDARFYGWHRAARELSCKFGLRGMIAAAGQFQLHIARQLLERRCSRRRWGW